MCTRIYSSDGSTPEEIKFMDMRLVFLITALCPEARSKAKHMIDLLIQILDDNLKKATENHLGHENLPPIFLTVRIVVILVGRGLIRSIPKLVQIKYKNKDHTNFDYH